MNVAVPREIAPGERRVALVPETVEKLVRSGVGVVVETGAGVAAFHADDAYAAAGARIAREASDLYGTGDLILKVRAPMAHPTTGSHEADLMRSGSALIAPLQPLINPELVRRLAERRLTAFSTDAIPRISRAQALDTLSSMSTVAGYYAVISAAQLLPRFFPLLMTAAGTLTPARVLIVGAGVAGLQAIATARRLGAVVEAFDTRPVVKEQVESLGATFVEASLDATRTEGTGGYARALDDDAQRRVNAVIADRVRESDVVITSALVPGRRAPILITEDAVRAMRPGSVIVDLAAEQGGNCALSRPGETVIRHRVTVHAPLNVPSAMPMHASQMYSRNLAAFLQLLVKDGALVLDFEDQIVRESCVTHEGRIVHEGARAAAEAPADARPAAV